MIILPPVEGTPADGSGSVADGCPCPVHAGRIAFITCPRCGRPACEYCLVQVEGRELCTECGRVEDGGGVIAWERRDLDWLRRFTRTLRDTLARPGATFAEMRPGSVGAALGYAALVFAVTSLGALVILSPCVLFGSLGWSTPLSAGNHAGAAAFAFAALCGGPFLQAFNGVMAALLTGATFHCAARLLGGRGDLGTSLRAAAYGTSPVIVWLLLGVAALLPGVGTAVLALVFLFQLAYGGIVLTTVARAHHGLRGARATLAGWATPAIALAAVALLVAAGIALDRAVTPSHAPDVYLPSNAVAPS